MCGICGICLDRADQAVDPELLARMSGTLRHRGPDGDGVYLNGSVALAHDRLAIIDLCSGAQPMFNEDGSIALVFNGEIYNYIELREQLLHRGHRLATRSDTEVIVHLYEDLGPRCVERLNGMFAFGLWDQRRQRLFAARDRLGEKPFYYFHRNGRFVFASELKALRCDPLFPGTIDPAALDDYLAYGYVPAPRTIYAGVHKLPAAHTLLWERGIVRTERYWNVSFDPCPRLDEHEYIGELRRRLDDAVRIRLRSDVPVGAFLSGGIDSSAVVALAARQTSKPLETFSVGFAQQDFDESPFARLVAERYATNHHEIRITDLDRSVFPDLVAHFDEPFADPSAIPTYYVTREARRFVTVCLSGDGGDELFAGYDRYIDCLRERWADWLPTGIRRSFFGGLSRLLPDHTRGKGLLRRLALAEALRYQAQVGVFEAEERRELLAPELVQSVQATPWFFEEYFVGNARDPVTVRQQTDLLTYLPEDVLVKVDRTSMKHALEVRVPFLDHTVVEWVSAMPVDMKIRRGAQKYVLKRMLEDLLPPVILGRPKRGFGIPLQRWFRDDLNSFARDLLLSPQSRGRAILRPEAVQRLLDAHRRGGRDFGARLWALLWLEQWLRCHGG